MEFDTEALFAPLTGIDWSELNIYVVGGAVRDTLLGEKPKDIDYVIVGSTPEELLSRKFQQVGQEFPVFLHPKSHVEVALARTERKTRAGHKGFVVQSDATINLNTDLKRRDFSVNAMAISPRGDLIDPYQGQLDISRRCLRHVSDAFVDDPLRVLRGIRFLAQLGKYRFHIAEETQHLMESMAVLLTELSVERIIVELDKTLGAFKPEYGLSELSRLKVMEAFAPELSVCPPRFECTSVDCRLAEWICIQEPTLQCMEIYRKRFKLTSKRHQFLKSIILLRKQKESDAWMCLDIMARLGWLSGNAPDPKIDQLLLETDRAGLCETPIATWFMWRNLVRGVNAKQFKDTGLSGKALGQAIYNARFNVLFTEISAPGTAPGL